MAGYLRILRRELTLPADSTVGEILRVVGSVTDRSGEVPLLSQLRAHFTQREADGYPDGNSALGVLDEIEQAALPVLSPSEFRMALDRHQEALLTTTVGGILIEAANIIRTGTTVPKREKDGKTTMVSVRGVEPALNHLHLRLRTLDTLFRRRVQEGDFRADMEHVVGRYDRLERDPSLRVGILSGLREIDNVHHGIRRGDLALVLGFVGHMKTTFCLNWMYKAAVFQQRNVAMASLETPVDILTDLVACIHTMHPDFHYDRTQHFVTYDRLRTGQLTATERGILLEAAQDLQINPHYGRMVYKRPEQEMTVHDIRVWCEQIHREHPLDLLVIDYLGLVDSEKGWKKDSYANLNDAIRQTKLMAIEFDEGRGLPILSPFQANREGFKDAEKNGGKYSLRALHGAPEAERSADLVYYVYLGDTERRGRELIVGNLKTRNVGMITDQFRVFADPATRMLDDLDLSKSQATILEAE